MLPKSLSFAVGSLALTALLVPSTTTTTASPPKTVDSSTTTLAAAASPATAHFTVNLGGRYAAAHSAGFNVFDVSGSTSNPAGVKAMLNGLPAGTKAMIWVGGLGNSAGVQGFTRAQFQAQVNALASDRRVFGYYLADEPRPILFPKVVAEIRARADYLRAKAPTQKSFIVVMDGTNACRGSLGCEYAALAPAKSHVDIIGVNPYPCHFGAACAYAQIPAQVNAAIKAGISRSRIVPVHQTFGQKGAASPWYRMPGTTEMVKMYAAWKASVPAPVMDYAYTWGAQSMSPQALINQPAFLKVVRAHNVG